MDDVIQEDAAQENGSEQLLIESLIGLMNSSGPYVEVLQSSSDSNRVKLRLRIFDGHSWNHVAALLLKEEIRSRMVKGVAWDLHLCRQLMLRKETNSLCYFWNFIVSSEDVGSAVLTICRVLDFASQQQVPVAPQRVALGPRKEEEIFTPKIGGTVVDGQVVSMPLIGGAGRNMPEGGFMEKGKKQKGAHPVGGKR